MKLRRATRVGGSSWAEAARDAPREIPRNKSRTTSNETLFIVKPLLESKSAIEIFRSSRLDEFAMRTMRTTERCTGWTWRRLCTVEHYCRDLVVRRIPVITPQSAWHPRRAKDFAIPGAVDLWHSTKVGKILVERNFSRAGSQRRRRSAPNTRPSVKNAITTSPTAPPTKGRKPCLPSSRMLVRSPTPAKVSKNAQRERFARLPSWSLLNTWAVAMAEMARKPRTNFGNLFQRNAALLPTCFVPSLRAQ